jgi:molybdate transport repressor ModE-like protein
MHVEVLKVFCDLIETGSFSLAASKNFITQSAVSQQIRNLEERYGRELVERSKGRVQLTQAGQVLYQAGKEIVQQYQSIAEKLQTLSHSVTGAVRVATVNSVGLYELAAPLKEYLRAFPDVNVRLEYARVARIYEAVGRGDIDLGLVAYPSKRPQILITAFREDRLVLICAPQHPFAQFPRLSIKKLFGEKFVGFERGVPTRRALDKIFQKHGVRVRYIMEVDNVETIKRAVEIGSGVSIVPELSVAQEVKNRTLKALQFEDEAILRPLGIISKRGRPYSPAIRKFVEFLTTRDAQTTTPEQSTMVRAGE